MSWARELAGLMVIHFNDEENGGFFDTSDDHELLVQETLLRMWQVAPRVRRDGRENSLLRLALRTARNLAIDEVRRTKPTAELPSEPHPEGDLAAPPVEPDPMLRRTIAICREKLPEQPARALDARLQSGGTNQSMSVVNGRSQTSVSRSWYLRVEKEGKVAVGPIVVTADGKTCETKPLTLTVTADVLDPADFDIFTPDPAIAPVFAQLHLAVNTNQAIGNHQLGQAAARAEP